MQKTIDAVRQDNQTTPLLIYATILWMGILALGSIVLAKTIFDLPDFGNLGRPVQVFVSGVALIPAILSVVGSVLMLRRDVNGRFIALILNYVGLVLSVIVLLHLWQFYFSFEIFVDTIMANPILLLGFPIAYGIYWLGGRFEENQSIQDLLTRIALVIGGLALIGLILASDVLNTANFILSTYSDPAALAVTVAAVIFGFLAWRMLHLGEYFGETPEQRTSWQGWMMLSPNIIGFLLFFAGPLLLSLYLSFTDSSVGQIPNVIGFSNYAELLSLEFQTQTDLSANLQDAMSFGYAPLGAIELGNSRLVVGAKDTRFWISLRNTLQFCLLLVPLSTIPAIGLALVLNSKLPGVKFFRALYFLPSVAAVVGTALIWRWLYDPTIGYFNYLISELVRALNNLGVPITDPQIEWLTGPGVVLFSIVFLSAWQVVGFNTVLFLAGLQGIPRELYEAANIDGANRWRQFLNVTLPMLAPTTFFVIITTVITGLQVFNEPYALFPARPIPLNATTSVFYLYERGFFRFEFGYTSAIAWILFIIIFGITFLQFRVQRSNAYSD